MAETRDSATTARRTNIAVVRFLRTLFGLRSDTDHEGTVNAVREGVEFRGGNLWALVLAILVASVGLNVNSTAVIIGAMLISPLMGPIMGAGLGIGINDLGLLRRSLRNIGIASCVSILASGLYFAISPLSEAQSELLARTRPTLYDVLIAFFGGSAGIVAASRKSQASNVVPGVAIATALMPPLCTAGYGLATRQWYYFFGAIYLFLINSVFICIATLVFVRLLRFPRVHELDAERERKVQLAIAAAAMITVLPSIYVAWRVVQETLFLSSARRFVTNNVAAPDRSIVATNFRYNPDSSIIDVTLIGRPLGAEVRNELQARLSEQGLKRTWLVIHEPMEAGSPTEELVRATRAGILEDLYRKNQEALAAREERIRVLEDEVVRLRAADLPLGQVSDEVRALYPTLTSLGFGRTLTRQRSGKVDTLVTVVSGWRRRPSAAELTRLQDFLKLRFGLDTLDLVSRLQR